MDDLLRSDALPWQLKAAIMLACGLAVALPILAIPKTWLARLGQLPGLSPNHVTYYRAAFCFVGALLFFFVSPFWGFLLYVAGCILDVTDGKMAVALREAGIERSARDLEIGRKIDPLCDKGSILPVLIIFAYKGVIWWPLVVVVVAADIFGTLTRDAWFMRKSAATWVGKIKTLLLCFVLIAGIPDVLRWVREPIVPNALLALAALFGIGSVVSRMRFRGIEEVVDAAEAQFKHKDV